jgi:hypothetical protein
VARIPPALVAIAASLVAGTASAQQPNTPEPETPEPAPPETPAGRLALVDLPDNLREAVEITLAAWPVAIIAVSSNSVGPTMPSTAAGARGIAGEHQAAAVVWLSSSADGPALWVLDTAQDRVVARPINSDPPFDDPTATAIALTIKTLLRHSLIAPEVERFGAVEDTAQPPVPPVSEPIPRVGVEAGTGVRIRPSEGVELRFGLALFWAPRRLAPVELALGVRSGLGTDVDTDEIAGTFRDNTISAGARVRLDAGPLAVSPYLTGSLHLTRLEGALAVDSSTVSSHRSNPSIDLGVRGAVPLGPLTIDLWIEGAAALRRQTYLVAGVEVLALPRFEAEVGLAISLPTRL